MSNKIVKSGKKQKSSSSTANTDQIVLEDIVCILGIAISVLVPLYLKDGYHGVGDCKYELYRVLMIIGTIVLFFVSMIGLLQTKNFIKTDINIRMLKNPELWVLLFLIFAFIAAIAGGNFTKCLIGYKGWYMGILSLISFAVLYYYFAHAGRHYRVVLGALLGTSFLTYIFGILNRLLIDVLGTYGLGTEMEINDMYKNMFLSTLGQSSWYSSFVCTVAPVGFAVFIFTKNKWLRIISGIFSLVASMTMVTQYSDSAYMAMLGFFFVLFWFAGKNAEGFRRFFELMFVFVMATRCMKLLFKIHPNPALWLDKISVFMLDSKWMWAVLFVAAVLWGVGLWMEKMQKYPIRFIKFLKFFLLAVILMAVAAVIVLLILGAKGKLPEAVLVRVQKIPYMVWSGDWGNGRGKTWSFSFQMYKDMDIGHKLFGVGPDGYAPYAYGLYAEKLEEMWEGQTLTNAHNEWLNALINYGLVGVICYIGIFISSICAFARHAEEEPVLIGFIACIVSYMCHNFFCYQTVCCTPYIFMIMGMGMYIVRKMTAPE